MFVIVCRLWPSYILRSFFNNLVLMDTPPSLFSNIFGISVELPIQSCPNSYISRTSSDKSLHESPSFIKFPWVRRKPKNRIYPAPSKKKSFLSSNNSNPQKTPPLLKLLSASSSKLNFIQIISFPNTVLKKPFPTTKAEKEVTFKLMTMKLLNNKALHGSNANLPFWRVDNLSTTSSLD